MGKQLPKKQRCDRIINEIDYIVSDWNREDRMKKAIFLDIDGTLTEPGSNVPPESAMRAVRAAREKGNYVFLCTGRNYDMLSPLLPLGFDGVVASCGGYVRFGDQVIYDCPMTREQRDKAMKVMGDSGVFRTIECLDGSYTDEGLKEFLRSHALEGTNSELLRWRNQIEQSLNIRPMAEYKGQPVYKMVVMADRKECFQEPEKALSGEFELCLQEPDQFGYINGELVNRKFDKGKGIQRACEYLGIPVEDTVGFGDSMNDEAMLKTVGLSLCMANGSEKMKELADDVCPAVTEDGLYQGFVKYGLC